MAAPLTAPNLGPAAAGLTDSAQQTHASSDLEATNELLLLLGQARKLQTGHRRLLRTGAHLNRDIVDLDDVAIDVFGHRALLLRRRGNLQVAITDSRHSLGNLRQQFPARPMLLEPF